MGREETTKDGRGEHSLEGRHIHKSCSPTALECDPVKVTLQ